LIATEPRPADPADIGKTAIVGGYRHGAPLRFDAVGEASVTVGE
jgi:hypothetical protein